MVVALLLPQFSFLFLFFLILQFWQFNCHNSIFYYYKFLAISLPKFLFLSPTSITSFLSPLSYFFFEFRQWCCRNSFLSSSWQIIWTALILQINFIFYNIQPKDFGYLYYYLRGFPYLGFYFFCLKIPIHFYV